MNKMLLRKGILIFALVALGTVSVGGAMAGLNIPGSETNTTGKDTSAMELLNRVTGWVLGIVGAIAVLFIIYGGFRYITAQGNSQQMDTAKNIIIKAIIGLVVVVVAYVIVQVVVTAMVSGTTE